MQFNATLADARTEGGASAVVTQWTGQLANALRMAMRMSNITFAAHLGLSVRSVVSWGTQPAMVPVPDTQAILDTALSRAPADVRTRFALLARSGPPADGDDLGSVVRRYRHASGRSQADVAAALGITQQNLSQIENGTVPVSVQRRHDLAALLDIPAPALGLASGPGGIPAVDDLRRRLEWLTAELRTIQATLAVPAGGVA